MTFPLGQNPFATPIPLYEVANRTHVRVADTGETFFFDHIDGMYSYCLNKDNQVVHLKAWTEVNIVKGF